MSFKPRIPHLWASALCLLTLPMIGTLPAQTAGAEEPVLDAGQAGAPAAEGREASTSTTAAKGEGRPVSEGASETGAPPPPKVAAGAAKEAGAGPTKEEAPVADVLKRVPVKITGYIQPLFTYVTTDGGPPSNFSIKRIRLRATGEVFTPKVTYTLLAELNSPSVQKIVRDGYVSYFPIKEVELRGGSFRVPFGYENWTSFVVIQTIERSLVSDNLVRGLDTRDLGFGLIGSIPLAGDFSLEYRTAIMNGTGGGLADTIPRKDPYGRIGLAYGKIVKLGFSVGSRKIVQPAPTNAKEETTLIGADLLVDYGPFFLLSEYVRGFYDIPDGLRRTGWYVLLVGRAPFDLKGLVRYEQYSPQDTDDSLTRKRVMIGANYEPFGEPKKGEDASVKLMVNYRIDHGAQKANALLVQVQYSF